jgi:hypothetical protein
MRGQLVWGVALLLGIAGPAGADTLADVLRAHGVAAPVGLPDLDRRLGSYVVSDEGGRLTVLYDTGPSGAPGLVALRVGPGPAAVTRVPVVWPRSASLDPMTCAGVDSIREYGAVVLVTAHVNPSASCTLVLNQRLVLTAVLPGWPVADLPGGKFVYERNQVHFAAVHPLALHLFDPARRADTPLYPQKPYQAVRVAHIATMRSVYTDAWCSAHNHPCDPDVFDEHLSGDILVDPAGDSLVFPVAFDNTTGWSDAERWGRLEPFRELRAALASWGGQSPPPDALARALVAGLTRARNLGAQPHVGTALAGDPELRDRIAAILGGSRPAGVDEVQWLATLDPRWNDPVTWHRLAHAIRTPDEFTDVVYVYTGLQAPARVRQRELLRSDFESRFGKGSLASALDRSALKQLFGASP